MISESSFDALLNSNIVYLYKGEFGYATKNYHNYFSGKLCRRQKSSAKVSISGDMQ